MRLVRDPMNTSRPWVGLQLLSWEGSIGQARQLFRIILRVVIFCYHVLSLALACSNSTCNVSTPAVTSRSHSFFHFAQHLAVLRCAASRYSP